MTLAVATAPTMTEALGELLFAAIHLHGADFGNIQLLDANSRELRIVAQQGFRSAFLEAFDRVADVDETACGRALRSRRLVQIADVTQDAAYAPYRRAAVDAGYQAVQSMPLIDRANALMGVLSVHFRNPHRFTERDQQLADMLGQQAADLIASRLQQDRLRDLNETLTRRTRELESSQEQLSRQAADLLDQDQAESKGLAMEYVLASEPPPVDADPERLAQILDNLLRNAITYRDAGAITLTVTPTPAFARFSVRDTGIGLDSEDLEMIFEPYRQRREGIRGGGLGLGLALVKGLVDAHGGTVTAYSGTEALAVAREHRPRVAFLDLSMPEMSGSGLARRLRQEFPASELTLVALTGQEKEYARMTEGIFDRHMLKPATSETVAAVLNETLART